MVHLLRCGISCTVYRKCGIALECIVNVEVWYFKYKCGEYVEVWQFKSKFFSSYNIEVLYSRLKCGGVYVEVWYFICKCGILD